MDVLRIIKQDGYKYDDLTDENKKVIDWCNYLINDLYTFEYQDDDVTMVDDDELTTIGKIKKEISDDVIAQIKHWMELTVADVQISLIENQEYKDNESND